MRERAEEATGPPARSIEPLRLPAPIDRLPWDVAQDELGVQAADFIGILSKVLLRVAQDERGGQVADIT
jgi:hypothetical protein